MLLSLLLLASRGYTAVPAADLTAQKDPPVHVWLNSDGDFTYRDRAKVYAKSAEDGFLVVLRTGMDGRVRVLFPVDPRDNQSVRAGRKYELKGRGGREAFVTEDSAGHGTVLAAFSMTPFRFEQFEKNGRWDGAALSRSDPKSVEADPEARLMGIVHEMQSPDEHYEYDVATYVVSPPPRYAHLLYPYPYGFGWWGYDPWWGYSPVITSRFWFGPRRFALGRGHL